ncbi:transposase [Mycolicibacterium wolinskyi]|uniref:transposase n=1 Tax=Mycolicibacterium wolinskyi TaxID=59750 RepID=UPI0039178B86
MAITWESDRGEHLARHGVTIPQAEEAFYDVDAVVINPDYASKSGKSVRTIGYSPSFGDLLAVITVLHGGNTYGATAFRAEGRDRRYYEEA